MQCASRTIDGRIPRARRTLALALTAFWLAGTALLAAGRPTVTGALVANGKQVPLPYAYAWAEKKGFYDEKDPTWTLLFVEHPLAPKDLGHFVTDTAWVEIGVTRTAEFTDQPELQVYSQSIKLAADAGGNLSGGEYPKIELTSAGPDRFAGRVYHATPQKFFDDTFQYDFTFDLPLSDLDAAVGEPLPPDGGEPGRAYLAWVAAVAAGDAAHLATLVPADLADSLAGDQGKEQIAFLQSATPTKATILGGSSDGETAVLRVEGILAGEKATGKVTLTHMDGFWIPTDASW